MIKQLKTRVLATALLAASFSQAYSCELVEYNNESENYEIVAQQSLVPGVTCLADGQAIVTSDEVFAECTHNQIQAAFGKICMQEALFSCSDSLYQLEEENLNFNEQINEFKNINNKNIKLQQKNKRLKRKIRRLLNSK